MKPPLRLPLLAFLIPLFLLSACGHNDSNAEKTAEPAQEISLPRSSLQLTTVADASIPRLVLLTGELQADKTAAVASDTTGKVLSAPIERGQAVRTGDILAEIDPRAVRLALAEAEAALAQSRAQLSLAQANSQRAAPLLANKAIAQSEADTINSELQVALANLQVADTRLANARKNLDDLTIRAPFDGQVVQRHIQVGEYVTPGALVVTLVATDTLRLVLNVPEPAVAALRQGQDITFTVAAWPNETFTASLRHIAPALRDTSRDLIIEAHVPNSDHRLLPGYFASARLLLRHENAPAVPPAALLRTPTTAKAYVLTSAGILEERLVEPGELTDNHASIEITRGLAKGEQVLLNPGPDLKDGQKVN